MQRLSKPVDRANARNSRRVLTYISTRPNLYISACAKDRYTPSRFFVNATKNARLTFRISRQLITQRLGGDSIPVYCNQVTVTKTDFQACENTLPHSFRRRLYCRHILMERIRYLHTTAGKVPERAAVRRDVYQKYTRTNATSPRSYVE